MQLYAQDELVPEESLEAFLSHLSNLFEEEHAEEKANLELNQHFQKGSSFRDFIAEFDRLLLLAGSANWSDSVKISRVRSAINQSLRKELIGKTLSRNYEHFRTQLNKVANDLEEYNRIESRRRRPASQQPTRARQSNLYSPAVPAAALAPDPNAME